MFVTLHLHCATVLCDGRAASIAYYVALGETQRF